MADRVGQRFGDYRLIHFLGEGTFGDVYLGEQVYEKSSAAIKVFKAKLTPDKFKDFINEVRTVLLRHPNIVQVLDFGIGEDDIPFLVMEYAPRGTLARRHPRGTRLPLRTVVTYVKQIAAALQYAHDHRRIHRDVKPENMLFGANDELVLSDFGIAAVAHSTYSQRTEEATGTALYMAPEQWQGRPVPATDQYALGIIVYEWLCGEPPFGGGTWQLMYQHLQAPPPSLHSKVPTIASKVEQVVMTALAKDPSRRFATVQAFANALEEACQLKLANAKASLPLEKTHLHISTVGGPSAGRTCYIYMALKEFIQVFGQEHLYTLSLPDTSTNQDLQMFWRRFDTGREALLTTDLDPQPYSVEIKQPKTDKSKQIYIYDPTGTRFNMTHPLDYSKDHFRLTNAVIFVIDPFSLGAYRRIHREEIARIQNTLRPAMLDSEQAYERMMKMFEAVFGEPGRGGYSQPLAVVLTKTDVLGLEDEIGRPAAKGLMTRDRFIRSEEEAISSLVRDFLSSYGLDQLVRNIESKFAKVKYFSCSALGRLPLPGDTSSFRPVRVMDSLVWLLTQAEFIEPMQKQE